LAVVLPAGARFQQPVRGEYNVFLYPSEGSVNVGPASAPRTVGAHAAAVLVDGDTVEVGADAHEARFILLAGRPLGAPIAESGPFVMNTREEIEQAVEIGRASCRERD